MTESKGAWCAELVPTLQFAKKPFPAVEEGGANSEKVSSVLYPGTAEQARATTLGPAKIVCDAWHEQSTTKTQACLQPRSSKVAVVGKVQGD